MSECYCDYGDVPAAFYRQSRPVARKEHRCYECGRLIRAGERYERVVAKWEDVEVIATCPNCLALREWVLAHVPCFCWMHGSLLDDAQATIEEYACECPGLFMGYGRLRVAIRRERLAARERAKAC